MLNDITNIINRELEIEGRYYYVEYTFDSIEDEVDDLGIDDTHYVFYPKFINFELISLVDESGEDCKIEGIEDILLDVEYGNL